MDDSYGLALAFDSDDPEFARGFEAGRLWGLLHALPDEERTETVHASNAEMCMRMAAATGRPFSATDLDETYVEISLGLGTEGT